LSGTADEVVQARHVSGGIHFYGSRSVDPPPRQLPADPRGFVNRREDLERLDVILTHDSRQPNAIAACIVVGTAGVGKTSLAVHWAHRVVDRFPDGQLYVNLHGYDPGPPTSPEEVLDRFLRALSVPAESIPADLESRAALYRSQLAGRRLLIVLDNAATVGQVRPLLPGIAGCLVIVTSRSRLSGLVARDGAHRLTLGVLPDEDAVELLRSVTSNYRGADNPGDLEELARLCARLPLALRIAAERAISRPQTPLRDLIADLRDESALWEALTADGDDEADAVRTVFAWSYRALSKDAGRLFRLLGLHPGPDFGTSAAAVLAGMPAVRVRRLLDDLAGAHLLEQPRRDRYQFHDLLRMYAADQVRAEEPAEESRLAVQRVLLWYLHTSDLALAELVPAARRLELTTLGMSTAANPFQNYTEASTWYEDERPSLLAAVRVAEEMAIHEIAWQLPAVLYPIYAERNQFDDWVATSLIALGAVRQLADRAGEAEILESLGKAHTQAANRQLGIEYQTAALAIRRDIGDRYGELVSTNAIGLAQLRGRELEAALANFLASNAVANELENDYWTAISLNNVANVRIELEQFDQAQPLLNQALTIYRRIGIRGSAGDALRGLSHVHRGLGQPEQAASLMQEALTIARQAENQAWEGFWLIEHGRVLLELEKPSEALDSFQRAAQIQRRLGDRAREALALDGTGEAYQRLGRHPEAASFHRLSAATFEELGETWYRAVALDHLATSLSTTERRAEAESAWREASTLLTAYGDPRSLRTRSRIARRLDESP
jgi:tetratricopeptide (TPR) repeat protein